MTFAIGPLDQIHQEALLFRIIMRTIGEMILQVSPMRNDNQLVASTSPCHVELASGTCGHLVFVERWSKGEIPGARASRSFDRIEDNDLEFEGLHSIDRANMHRMCQFNLAELALCQL